MFFFVFYSDFLFNTIEIGFVHACEWQKTSKFDENTLIDPKASFRYKIVVMRFNLISPCAAFHFLYLTFETIYLLYNFAELFKNVK